MLIIPMKATKIINLPRIFDAPENRYIRRKPEPCARNNTIWQPEKANPTTHIITQHAFPTFPILINAQRNKLYKRESPLPATNTLVISQPAINRVQMVIYNVNPRVKKLFLAFHFFEWKIGIELRNSDIEMKIGKTTICAADIDRDKFQISELDPNQNLRKKKKKRSEKTKYEKLKQIPFDICRPPLH